ncbi:hypothetical protein [Pseudomonas sp. RIT-To-2]|uniref:hypothetical protein n=1 Tax=Pseudomonas sp. RIT-To-2 TaxID=3462541 RepID=UPI002412EED5
MNFLITHQTQPTPNTCFSTCLAMIQCVPAGVMVGKIHEWYFAGSVSTRQALDKVGIPFESFDTADLPAFGRDGVYMVAVPSINEPGWLHQVLCECYDGNFIVHDPNRGRRDCKHYVAALTEGCFNEVKFHGYVIDAFIPRSYLLERYSWRAAS